MNTAKRHPRIDQPAYRANVRRWQAMMTNLSKESGLPRDQVEQICRDKISELTGGDSSSKALTNHQWAKLFNFLNDRLALVDLGRPQPQFRPDRNPDALPTAKQRRVIETLRELLDWSTQDLQSFTRKYFGWRKGTTRARANKLIDALKPQVLRHHQVAARVAIALQEYNLDQADRHLLADVARQLESGKQGANVRVGAIPVCIKVLNRYGVPKVDDDAQN